MNRRVISTSGWAALGLCLLVGCDQEQPVQDPITVVIPSPDLGTPEPDMATPDMALPDAEVEPPPHLTDPRARVYPRDALDAIEEVVLPETNNDEGRLVNLAVDVRNCLNED